MIGERVSRYCGKYSHVKSFVKEKLPLCYNPAATPTLPPVPIPVLSELGGKMQATPHRNGFLIIAFVLVMFVIITLAFSSTTWAAPNAQGTVPTPPKPTSTAPTAVPTDSSSGGDNGGNNGGDNDGNNNNGGQLQTGNENTAPTIPAGAGSVCAIGDAGAQCSAGDLIIVAGAGVASPGSALAIEGSFPQPPCPTSPTGHIFMNRCYRYAWIGTSAEPLTEINGPVQYCINFGPAELAAVNNDANLFLIGVAGADGAWTMLKPVVDSSSARTCATSNQLLVWSALFAPQNPTAILPTVGAVSNNLWVIVISTLGLALLIGAARLFKRAAK